MIVDPKTKGPRKKLVARAGCAQHLEEWKVSINFVITNQGRIMYLDELRPILPEKSDVGCNFCNSATIPTETPKFALPSVETRDLCPGEARRG